MLILVAVTINLATDGGLFDKSRTASKNTQIEADKETLLAAVVGAYDATNQEVKEEELKTNLGKGWQTEKEGEYYKATSPNGNEFKVNAKNATIENYIEETAPVITINGTLVTLTKANVYEYLGKEVTNYIGQSSVTIGSTPYTVSPTYRLYYVDFDDKYGDGPGTIYLKAESTSNGYQIPTTDTSLNTDTNIKIKALNPLLYAGGEDTPSSSNSNMKAVTWLTNINNWASLEDKTMSNNINYIVGAPSLEMMMDSYNMHYQLTGDTPDYTAITAGTRRKLFYKYTRGENGYKVGPCAGDSAEYGLYTSNNSVYTDLSIDSMYYPSSNQDYWLASPISNYSSHYVMLVNSDDGGFVDYGSIAVENAFCPVVSLKSNAQLQLR